MRKSRFTEVQIIGMIKKQEDGLPTAELCRRHGLSPAAFHKLKGKYGGMDLSATNRLKQLGAENAKLKRLVADPLVVTAVRQFRCHAGWTARTPCCPGDPSGRAGCRRSLT
jgi:putative transposase